MKHRIAMSLTTMLITLAVTGCVKPMVREATTTASYNEVFDVAIQAASEKNFAVTSADKMSGVITGNQGILLGRGNQVGLTIRIARTPPHAVNITTTLPPGAIPLGSQNISHEVFLVMQKHLPDLQSR